MYGAQVSDCTDDKAISASAVFSALDYAFRMGAHIVSMSLGSSFAYGSQPRSGVRAAGHHAASQFYALSS